MDEPHPPRAESVEAGGQLGPSFLRRQVDAGGPQVARVEADPEAGMVTGGVEQLGGLLGTAGEGAPAAGRELQEQVDAVGHRQQPGQRPGHPRQCLRPGRAHGMAGVDDDAGCSYPRRPLQGEGGAGQGTGSGDGIR